MHNDEEVPAKLGFLTFHPRIKGIPRAFKIRTMQWRGALWLVAKDVGAAAGWHPDTIRHRRLEASAGRRLGLCDGADRPRQANDVGDRPPRAVLATGGIGEQAGTEVPVLAQRVG